MRCAELFYLSQRVCGLSLCNAATSLQLYTSGILYPGPNRTCALVWKISLENVCLNIGSKDAVRISTPQARTQRGNIYTLLLRAVSVKLTARRTNRPLHECYKSVQRENTSLYEILLRMDFGYWQGVTGFRLATLSFSSGLHRA